MKQFYAEPSRDWKPEERVLVEATIFSGRVIDGSVTVVIGGMNAYAPISSIRPMPEREGGE